MAIGLARMFGFRLLENFNMPYVATSITDFWRRWHMSLTSWIREYLYFPLGGNRRGEARTYFNLWVCFLASGIWHGAAWTYVAWGAYNGVFLVLDRLFLVKRLERLPDWLANIVTMFVVVVGWTLFRAVSLTQAGALLSLMAQPWAQASAPVAIPEEYIVIALISGAICVAQRVALYFEGFDWAVAARATRSRRTARCRSCSSRRWRRDSPIRSNLSSISGFNEMVRAWRCRVACHSRRSHRERPGIQGSALDSGSGPRPARNESGDGCS